MAIMSLSGHSEITGIEGEGASAPSSPIESLSREARVDLMRLELVQYFSTGIEPDVAPHSGADEKGEKLLRCTSCNTLVWKSDKKKLREDHLAHQLVVAVGGSVQEALMLKYDLIRSEEDE